MKTSPLQISPTVIAVLVLIGWAPSLAAQNDLLVASPNLNSIQRFDGFSGESLGSFVTAGSGGLMRPGDVAVGLDNHVYVTSASTNQVIRYDGETGDFIDVFISGQGLSTPNNLTFFGDSLYVGNFGFGSNGGVLEFDARTGALRERLVDVNFADGIAIGGGAIFVSNFFGGVGKYDLETGDLIEEFASPNEGNLENPTALLINDDGGLLVSSYGTDSVKHFSASGDYLGDVITGLVNPEGLEIGLDGNLYAGSFTLGVINQYDSESYEFLSEFATNGSQSNFFTFRGPTAVPEPSTVMTATFVAAWCAVRHRRKRTKRGVSSPAAST